MALVRAGRLFEVQRWIAEGRRTNPPKPYWFSPLRTAIATGFHSMVEILLKAGVDRREMDTLLNRAVWNSNLDLIQLLVDHGANLHSVDADCVFRTGDPEIIRFFFDRGMDVISGDPFAHALKYPKRTFIGVYMRYREKIPELRRQVDLALRHHARDGNLKWVSLLLWTGADPYVRLPDIDEDPDPDSDTTALEEAVRSGHHAIIKRIGIDSKKADLARLLIRACRKGEWIVIDTLLNCGASPNGAGRSDPMDQLLWSFARRINPYIGCRSEVEMRTGFEAVLSLADRGGRWNPDRASINRFRRDLYKLDAIWIERIALGFFRRQVCSRDVIVTLMNTAKMKGILGVRHSPCLSSLASNKSAQTGVRGSR